jgi:hypothetical protein
MIISITITKFQGSLPLRNGSAHSRSEPRSRIRPAMSGKSVGFGEFLWLSSVEKNVIHFLFMFCANTIHGPLESSLCLHCKICPNEFYYRFSEYYPVLSNPPSSPPILIPMRRPLPSSSCFLQPPMSAQRIPKFAHKSPIVSHPLPSAPLLLRSSSPHPSAPCRSRPLLSDLFLFLIPFIFVVSIVQSPM